MTDTQALLTELDRWAAAGKVARFWLRDDDAVVPTAPLDRLLALTQAHDVPVTLAVIPAGTGEALADRLVDCAHATVTVHGWSHVNHAPMDTKKQELGGHRPKAVVLAELGEGIAKLAALHGARFSPVLVPPWNRIDVALLPHLPALGYRGLSVYGPEKAAPLAVVNTHVDVMDWHGTRGGRSHDGLLADIVMRLKRMDNDGGTMGLLTHHLVHDETVWQFLAMLFAATKGHPACRWTGLPDILP